MLVKFNNCKLLGTHLFVKSLSRIEALVSRPEMYCKG